MWLLRAAAMGNINVSDRFSRAPVIADVLAGLVLIIVIIFSFLALMSFADFLRFHQMDDVVEEVVPPVGGAAGPVRPRQPNGAGAQRNAPPEHRGRPDEEIAAEELFPGVHERHDLGLPPQQRRQEVDDGNGENDNEPRQPVQELRQRRPLREPPVMDADAPVDDEDRPVRDDVPAPPPVININPPRNPPMNNNNNNRDAWDDDFEHMEINIAMEDLIGLRGDIVVLFRNVSWLLAFNGAYLGLFAFIPYTLGSTILSASWKIASALPFSSTLTSLAANDPNIPVDQLDMAAFIVRQLTLAIDNARSNGDCLQLVDLCTCAVGYLSICFTIVLWRWMVTTASSYIHRPLVGGLLWALRCLTAIVKVSTLLLLKMVVLPIVLGLGIDFFSLRLFNVTAQERIVFCMHNMVGALLVHWVLGITFMLFVTVSVLQLREVMHPDILANVIRPQEAHPDLLRSLLSENSMKHARRMVASLVIYTGLLIMLVNLPIRLAQAVAPQLFPVVLRFQHYSPEVQVPIELLIVHLVVLAVLEHSKNEIGRLQHVGLVAACRYLGLSEMLLPRVQDTWNARPNGADAAEEVHILPPPPLHFHPSC
ncbi:hypothetical protein PINS_up002878 [Pythium insidiosum]|nr:hypothetical protein PINS_up002878 [Pythium insidiosum]